MCGFAEVGGGASEIALDALLAAERNACRRSTSFAAEDSFRFLRPFPSFLVIEDVRGCSSVVSPLRFAFSGKLTCALTPVRR